MKKTLVLATHNQGKIIEIQHALDADDLDLRLQSDFNIEQAEETGLTFIENAIIKARHATKWSGLPALADDSGIVIDALAGRPGIYSARYAGKDSSSQENITKVLQELKDIPSEKRTARFYGVLVYLEHEHDPKPLIFEGQWEGSILQEPINLDGFGYDPIFYVPTHKCAASELSITEKNQISHRGLALAKLKEFLLNYTR